MSPESRTQHPTGPRPVFQLHDRGGVTSVVDYARNHVYFEVGPIKNYKDALTALDGEVDRSLRAGEALTVVRASINKPSVKWSPEEDKTLMELAAAGYDWEVRKRGEACQPRCSVSRGSTLAL